MQQRPAIWPAAACDASLMQAEGQELPMITRRRILAATGGAAALAATRVAAAQTPIPNTQGRNTTMDIKRNGSRPSGKGPEAYFTGTGRVDPMLQAGDPARGSGGH